MCGAKPEDRTIVFRVYKLSASDTWSSISLNRNLKWTAQLTLVADTKSWVYTVPSGSYNNNERALIIEKNGYSYVLYVNNDNDQNLKDFNFIYPEIDVL